MWVSVCVYDVCMCKLKEKNMKKILIWLTYSNNTSCFCAGSTFICAFVTPINLNDETSTAVPKFSCFGIYKAKKKKLQYTQKKYRIIHHFRWTLGLEYHQFVENKSSIHSSSNFSYTFSSSSSSNTSYKYTLV